MTRRWARRHGGWRAGGICGDVGDGAGFDRSVRTPERVFPTARGTVSPRDIGHDPGSEGAMWVVVDEGANQCWVSINLPRSFPLVAHARAPPTSCTGWPLAHCWRRRGRLVRSRRALRPGLGATAPDIYPVSLLYCPGMKATAEANNTKVHLASARFFRVLGDPTRLAILELLIEGPRTVSELVAAIGLAQSRVSNHLACLRWCRFVDTERHGRQVVYSIGDRRIGRLLAQGRALLSDHADHLARCERIGPDWI